MEKESNEISLGIVLHQKFHSLDEIQRTINESSKKKFVQFYVRDSRAIDAAKKKVKRYLNPTLKFYQMKYTCIHGGQKFSCKATGKRNRKTFKKIELCPAHVSFRISDSGNDFQVVSIDNCHNHIVPKALYQPLPQNRRLPDDIRDDAVKLLKLKANKHLIRQEIENRSNRCVTLKDLSNLRQNDRSKFSNNIKSACEKINLKYGTDCHLLLDPDNNTFAGLMFCTKAMQQGMAAYPELICIDATYKLLQIRAPVYIILIEDGNGESQIVAVAILTKEDKQSLSWFLELFKKLNPSWTMIKNIMADKDLNERQLLKESFPMAQLHICIFHVFKIFQREITCEKMNISSVERTTVLEYLQKLVYSRNETEFYEIQNEINTRVSQNVLNYLNKHWIDIKEEWCPRVGEKVSNFLNTTNNRLEGLNSKLKAVITKHSTLEEFLEHFFVAIESLEKEKDNRIASAMNKRSTSRYLKEQIQYKYEETLTPYAFKKLLPQIDNLKTVKILSDIDNEQFRTTTSGTVQYETTAISCTYYFSKSMSLICKHILKIRDHLNMELFDLSLIHKRWTMAYFLANHRLFLENELPNVETENLPVTVTAKPKASTKAVLSQQEKYKTLLLKCKLIASLGSESCGTNFENISHFLNNVIDSLNNGCFNLKLSMDSTTVADANSRNDDNSHNDEIERIIEDDANEEPYIDATDIHTTTDEVTEHQQMLEYSFDINISDMSYMPSQIDATDLHTNVNVTEDQNMLKDLYDINMSDMSPTHTKVSLTDLRIVNEQETLDTLNSESNVIEYAESIENQLETQLNSTLRDENENHPNTSSNTMSTINLEDIKIGPIFKKRGRPKGTDATVIGLPRKRRKSSKKGRR